MSKAQVIVGAHVESLGGGSTHLEVEVAVVRRSVEQIDVSAWDASSRSIEAVVDSHLQSPDIKVVEIAVQSRIPIACFQVSVLVFLEFHTKEISNVAEYYKNEVGYVGGEEEEVGRLVEDRLGELTSLMSASVTVRGRVEGSELSMLAYLFSSFGGRGGLKESGGSVFPHILGVCSCG